MCVYVLSVGREMHVLTLPFACAVDVVLGPLNVRAGVFEPTFPDVAATKKPRTAAPPNRQAAEMQNPEPKQLQAQRLSLNSKRSGSRRSCRSLSFGDCP